MLIDGSLQPQSTRMEVLIIDRSIHISQRIGEQLSGLNNVHAVQTVELTEDVFALLSEIKPGVVLIGIGLPANDTLELLLKLKTSGTKTTVIVFYLNMDEILRELCIDLGADYFIDLYHDFSSIPVLIESLAKKNP